MASKGWFRPMFGFHPHRPMFRHRAAATLIGGMMWFWILVRMKEDGPVLLGWRHPWDHHGDHHDEHH
ncbi:hypothetical protein MARU1_003266 [Malassezia arunalokei]|uniref:NADH dehydrogenase [ubiquinone] 1 beta subcomplex subunit 2 n=1 Tax=Malassezia arunalokei TaxID=1514897 RepID=A0AAJ5Z2V8_9BASI|nr:hypothetical protein MARU1_003266 [Malassezia arunalokei]